MLSDDQQVALVHTPIGSLAGQTPATSGIRERTGVTVLAVECDGRHVSDLEPDFRFQAGDDVVVAGPDDAVTTFTGLFGTADPRTAVETATTD